MEASSYDDSRDVADGADATTTGGISHRNGGRYGGQEGLGCCGCGRVQQRLKLSTCGGWNGGSVLSANWPANARQRYERGVSIVWSSDCPQKTDIIIAHSSLLESKAMLDEVVIRCMMDGGAMADVD